jgi:PAS domain S-box-containing protein
VTVAHDGVKALEVARADPPDLVVSDLLMPVMDGYSLLRHWKLDANLVRIPFVIYTATYTDMSDQSLAEKLGVDAFLTKPLDPADFISAIEAVYRRRAPTLRPSDDPLEETAVLRQYSEALIRKLEERSEQLEATNLALQREIAERRHLDETQTAILNALPAHIALIDTRGVILSVNEAWRRFAEANGLQGSGFGVGSNYLAITHGAAADCAEAEPIAEGIRRVLEGEATQFTMQYPCHSPTEQRWFRVTATPLRKGQASGAVVMHTDITSRVQAEMDLRESEERFRQLAENINEVFWINDPVNRKLLYVSAAYETIWQRSCDSLYQAPNTWQEAIDDEDRPRVMNSWHQRQTRGGYDETYRIHRPDGTDRWIRDRAFPVQDADGKVYRVVGLAEDITERKKIEAQFLRAQRMESIGTLAGGIAHDLNNVLSPILLSIEMLKMDEQDALRLEVLDTIERSAMRGADMVGQVLSFARGIDGKRISVQTRDIMYDLLKIARDTFPRNIELRSTIPGDLWLVPGDPTQIHQVLLNLVVNARDAMPQGGRITISARNITLDEHDLAVDPDIRPGPAVSIEIEDSGTGMAPELLSQIFDPFFTTKAPGSGTGLGLSTSLAIVKSHGGFIRVYSELGKGTRFRICLPAETGTTAMAVSPTAAELPRGSGELVLVVDDEPAVLTVARGTLEAFGYRVITAADGAEALASFASRKNEIALVLTDMMMPVMDGMATIRVLRHLNATVPIIAASGLSSGGRAVQAAEYGVRHFLQKPYTAEILLKTVADALRQAPPPSHGD